MATCWTSYQSGPNYGQYNITYTLDGAPLPALPIPSYVTRTLNCCGMCTACWGTQTGYQYTLLTAHANARWGANCNPPDTTPWQPISTGPFSLDVGATGGDIRQPSGSAFTMSKGHAIAVRFTPTSRFLPYIILGDVVNFVAGTGTGSNTIVEIRENNSSSNLPKGIPGDTNVVARTIVRIPAQQLVDAGGNWTSTIYDYNPGIPLNAIIAGTNYVPDTPYWIIFYSDDFMCSDAFLPPTPGVERIKFSTANTGRNDVAIWSQTGGCAAWTMTTTINSIAFTTFKTDNGTPPINVLDYGFAELAPSPTYVNTNCFGSRVTMQDKNVAIGISYEVPRHYQRIRLNIAYRRPDGRYNAFTYEIIDVTMGTHQIYVDTGEKYTPGVYTDIAVTAVVLIV
jgi:hypothetical protein